MALAGLVILCGGVLVRSLLEAGRTRSAARRLAVTMQALRWKSVALNRSHGLWFREVGEVWCWHEVVDGNRNGLRTSELRAGVDRLVSGPHRPAGTDGRVGLGLPPSSRIPRPPPGEGWLELDEDPMRFGRTNLVSFSPLGSASSGTVFVSDGRQRLFAVVLFGPTARVRVWRYDWNSRRWSL